MAKLNPLRRQLNMVLDEATAEHIDKLGEVFGVGTQSAVIRRSLAISMILAKYVDQEGIIHLTNDGRQLLLPLKF